MSKDRPSPTSLLWLLVVVLLSVIAALVATIVKHATGAGLAEAVLTGGSAFATTLLVCVGVLAAIRLL